MAITDSNHRLSRSSQVTVMTKDLDMLTSFPEASLRARTTEGREASISSAATPGLIRGSDLTADVLAPPASTGFSTGMWPTPYKAWSKWKCPPTSTSKRSQTVRCSVRSVRKPFVWGLTWGNTGSKRQAFVNCSPAVCLVRSRTRYSTNVSLGAPRTGHQTCLRRPGRLVVAHAFLVVGRL